MLNVPIGNMSAFADKPDDFLEFCTGMVPLIRQLVGERILRQDEAKIGFSVDQNYRCSDSPNIYYVGPMLKARYWEAIAVPELRVHSMNLAKTLLASLHQDE